MKKKFVVSMILAIAVLSVTAVVAETVMVTKIPGVNCSAYYASGSEIVGSFANRNGIKFKGYLHCPMPLTHKSVASSQNLTFQDIVVQHNQYSTDSSVCNLYSVKYNGLSNFSISLSDENLSAGISSTPGGNLDYSLEFSGTESVALWCYGDSSGDASIISYRYYYEFNG